MTVALLSRDGVAEEAHLRWAARVAAAMGRPLLVLQLPSPTDGEAGQAAAAARLKASLAKIAPRPDGSGGNGSEAATDDARIVIVADVEERSRADRVRRHLASREATLLIVPRRREIRRSDPEFAIELEIANAIDCAVAQLRVGDAPPPEPDAHLRIGVAVASPDHADVAYRFAAAIAAGEAADLELLHVRLTSRIAPHEPPRPNAQTDTRIETADSVPAGIAAIAASGEHDAIVVGSEEFLVATPRRGTMLCEEILDATAEPGQTATVFVCHAPPTAGSRVFRALDRIRRRRVPQLTRDERRSLIDDIEANSEWNFDFVAMLGLSSLIAAMGLEIGSVIVVIGAMLVAPLMTPILGLAAAMLQGNLKLAAGCLRTVAYGVACGVLVGLGVGLVFRAIHGGDFDPGQMVTERVLFTPVDVLVALVSGMVAAYARGRAELSSALPGVAIATSLVPPLAAVGIAIAATLDPAMGLGIGLFMANLIAILGGACFAFWLAGLRGPRELSSAQWWARWSLWTMYAAVAVFFVWRLTEFIEAVRGAANG